MIIATLDLTHEQSGARDKARLDAFCADPTYETALNLFSGGDPGNAFLAHREQAQFVAALVFDVHMEPSDALDVSILRFLPGDMPTDCEKIARLEAKYPGWQFERTRR